MTFADTFPLVSIITPSFNQVAYLEHTIRSVLSQDYPAIEYILVDGGSSDGSLEIIEKYASKFSWWVSEQDQGQAHAINKGLQHARGEIVSWVNSDDLYLPGAVTNAVKAFKGASQAGMVYGNAITIDAQGRPIKRLSFPDWGLKEFIGFRIICQPAVFMRRSSLEGVGYLDPSYDYMLDHQLWLRIAAKAPVKHVPQVWAAARHHPAAKNAAQPVEFGRETMRLLAWMNSQPGLATLIAQNQRQVEAGAYRLTARYLLDGAMPREALRAYGRAVRAQPGFGLQHWHRILYAVLSLLGAGGLASWYYRLRRTRRPDLEFELGIADWPGLCLEAPQR